MMQNMMSGDGYDRNKRQKMWRRDVLRTDDFTKMKDMV